MIEALRAGELSFHVGRVNGTIEKERILWREKAAAPKKEKIFDSFGIEERRKNCSYEVFQEGGWRIEGGNPCFERGAHALSIHQGEIHAAGLQGKKPAATFTKIHAQHAGDFSLTRRDQYTEDFFRGAHGDILDFFSGAKEGAKNHTKKKPNTHNHTED
ncbi:hypothetical protein CK203_117423 [Vitis vinifera]|uniref:Uncharacterized protein n=1 Tax=Vitis vinifera TaxID=29760 RepID=A0A438FCM4_VITVI|nr:hypothetical protein CK203_117423 [Vitis vinifera]